MYVRFPAGVLLALMGLSALPAGTPAMRAARLLLVVAGLGFGCYLVGALVLVAARLRLRRRGRARA